MSQHSLSRVTPIVLGFSAFVLCAGRTSADEIPGGSYSTTITITEDSELTGNINCTMTGKPCIAFGASGVKLRLNGFTISGVSGTSMDCTAATATDGIDVTGLEDVAILGPGLVEKFRVFGIALRRSTSVKVEGVTATDNCFSGIFLTGTTQSDIEKNVSVRNSMHSGGNPCGGT